MDVFEEYIPHTNKFVKDYVENGERAQSLFDYGQSSEDIKKRLYELSSRTYPKESLYKHLYKYNNKLKYNIGALRELDKLHNPDAVMMVTGQQAGILSGPFYTITKALTILKEAEAKEEMLGVPVLPVFWIAGEDHDWDEVNHIFLPNDDKPRKVTYKGEHDPGKPVSDQLLDEEAFERWWREVMTVLPETNHTTDVYHSLQQLAGKSLTMTDFFAEVMRWLFKDTGLIMLDANHHDLRQMETDMFLELIHANNVVRDAVKQGIDNRKAFDYETPEGLSDKSAQLFYHYHQKRQLLYKQSENMYTDKTGNLSIHENDLIKQASSHPENLSTNALTRPLIQEQLLPVLGYIAGPGEINYWSLLKPLFHRFGLYMPPLLPRMEITVVPRFVQSVMDKESLTVPQLLKSGAGSHIEQIRKHAKKVDGASMAEELLQEIEPYHANMQQEWGKIAPSERSYGETNWKIIQKEIYSFAEKIDNYQENKEMDRVQRIKKAEQMLVPFNNPQERVYNMIFFLNKYGSTFVQDLKSLEIERNGKHKYIKM